VFAEFQVAEGLPLPNRLVVRWHGLHLRSSRRTPRPDGNDSVAATLKPGDGSLGEAATQGEIPASLAEQSFRAVGAA